MLPGLKVKIGADVSDFVKGTGDVQAKLQRLAKIAATAAAAVAASTAAIFSKTAQAIDAQAKLAQSLGTTVQSMQVLERAGELAGVGMSGIEQATKDLTRRLSQAASGTGPAVAALDALGLSANELLNMPLDERVRAINEAIAEFVPAAQRAAVAGMLFGEEGSIAMGRLDSATIQQAADDVRDFGVALTEVQADNIEAANDSLSRLGLIGAGLANQLTAALAPAVKAVADGFAEIMKIGHPFRELLEAISGRIAAYGSVLLVGASAWGAYAVAVKAATVATGLFNGALALTRSALIRTGIGAIVVLLGELVFRAASAAEKFGGLGKVIGALWAVFKDRFERMKAVATVFGTNFQLMVNDIKFAFQQALIDMATKFFDFANSTAKTMNEIFKTNFATDMGSELLGSMNDKLAGINDEMVSILGNQANALDRLSQPVLTLEQLLNQVKETTGDLGTSTDDVTTDMAAGFNLAANAANDLQNVLTAAQSRAKSAAEMIGQKMEDAFMGMIDGTKSAGDAFRSMAKSIIAELFRIFVVKRITGFITNAIGSALGVPAAAMAPAVESYEGGGYTGMGPRSGGVDGRGGFPAIVHPNETIIDHNKIGNTMAGGGVTVVQHNTFGNGVNRAEINAMLPKIVEASKAAVLDAKRRGGSYGGAF